MKIDKSELERQRKLGQGLTLVPEDVVTERPEWFHRALQAERTEGSVQVNGCPVHYLEWGDRSKPSLLMVHGNGAHAWWFLSTGVLLSEHFHCVAMTFTGMGDSGWRERYDLQSMVDDIVGVVEGLQLHKPVLVAHSFGGMVSVPTAVALGDRLGALVIVDFVVRPASKVREWFADAPASRPTAVRPTKEAVLKRFRLLPPQPCPNQWLVDFIADKSVRPVAGGWTWKFDPAIYDNMLLGTEHERMTRTMTTPLGLIYGEHTAEFEQGELADMLEILPEGTAVAPLPQSGHHVMLDQPQGFAELVRRVIAKIQP